MGSSFIEEHGRVRRESALHQGIDRRDRPHNGYHRASLSIRKVKAAIAA